QETNSRRSKPTARRIRACRISQPVQPCCHYSERNARYICSTLCRSVRMSYRLLPLISGTRMPPDRPSVFTTSAGYGTETEDKEKNHRTCSGSPLLFHFPRFRNRLQSVPAHSICCYPINNQLFYRV